METVAISKEEYESLKRQEEILEALYAGGVDNWEGYGYSLDEFQKRKKEANEKVK